MTSRYLAWICIIGFCVPVALHTCLRWPLAWTGTCVGAVAFVLAAAGHRREALLLCCTGTIMLLRLLWGVEGSIPGTEALITALAAMRREVIAHIGLLLPEPHASFLAGVLTGERTDIPKDITVQMQRTGLTHILAISGTNITLILVALEHLLFFLPRAWRFPPLVAGITVFTLFSGASASAVRACIMGVLQLVALQTGRPPVHRLLIGWTFAGMLLFEPSQLRDDAGFQLSFLAVIGLCEFQKPLKSLLRRVPDILGLQEALVMTLAAQLTASPWAAYVFGTLPLHSALLNIIVAPLIPVAMLSGTGAVVIGAVSLTLGRIVMLPAWLALSCILWTGKIGAAFPAFILSDVQGSATLLTIWACCLCWLLWRTKRNTPKDAMLTAHAAA